VCDHAGVRACARPHPPGTPVACRRQLGVVPMPVFPKRSGTSQPTKCTALAMPQAKSEAGRGLRVHTRPAGADRDAATTPTSSRGLALVRRRSTSSVAHRPGDEAIAASLDLRRSSDPAPRSVKHGMVRQAGREHECRVLVETGTYLGDMLVATDRYFDRHVPIELGEELWQRALLRLAPIGRNERVPGTSTLAVESDFASLLVEKQAPSQAALEECEVAVGCLRTGG
jgi:hypothetical protein